MLGGLSLTDFLTPMININGNSKSVYNTIAAAGLLLLPGIALPVLTASWRGVLQDRQFCLSPKAPFVTYNVQQNTFIIANTGPQIENWTLTIITVGCFLYYNKTAAVILTSHQSITFTLIFKGRHAVRPKKEWSWTLWALVVKIIQQSSRSSLHNDADADGVHTNFHVTSTLLPREIPWSKCTQSHKHTEPNNPLQVQAQTLS